MLSFTEIFCFPAAHISCTLPEEYNTVEVELLKLVQDQLQERQIKFKITGVKVLLHQERSGKKFWLAAYTIECDIIEEIRSKLKLVAKGKMNYHLTVHEKEIIE